MWYVYRNTQTNQYSVAQITPGPWLYAFGPGTWEACWRFIRGGQAPTPDNGRSEAPRPRPLLRGRCIFSSHIASDSSGRGGQSTEPRGGRDARAGQGQEWCADFRA
jgi:hypothetical protein